MEKKLSAVPVKLTEEEEAALHRAAKAKKKRKLAGQTKALSKALLKSLEREQVSKRRIWD